MTDFYATPIHEAAARLDAGEIQAQALCAERMEACELRNGDINAMVHIDAEGVRRAAAESDRRRADGQALSPYDGIPVAIKDNMAVDGQPCTCASRILRGFTAPYDATAIARLKAAGLIPCGRTNMDEFAMGSANENSAFGAVSNPHDLDCVPGGSSGGSAAAVASGMALAALGSDTGGSIRQPASFCGVVGLKPTYGRVSRYGLVAFASSLDQIGPITRDVRDAAILLRILGGVDPHDSTSLDREVPDYLEALNQTDVKDLRIGIPAEYFQAEGLDSEVRSLVEAAAAKLEANGARLVEVALPHTKYAVAAYYIIATAEASANLARFDGIRYGARATGDDVADLLDTYRKSRARGFGEEVKRRIILGTYVLSSGYYDAYYLKAQKTRTLVRRDFAEAFESCDVILGPTAPTPAFSKGSISDPLALYLADIFTIPANLAGICGISVPCGTTATGLPVGLQLMAPALEESRLLQAAHAFEQMR
ncbi:MAG: Asp-tRNA(Asn)/Glu-tRNA(Gln) amidotransferase subunit GatA [Verrucomicrobiota bacterium]